MQNNLDLFRQHLKNRLGIERKRLQTRALQSDSPQDYTELRTIADRSRQFEILLEQLGELDRDSGDFSKKYLEDT